MTKKTRLKKTFGGTLATISVLLLGSALLRVGLAAGEAMAAQPEEAGEQSAPLGQCEPQVGPVALLDALRRREQRVSVQERQINNRLSALKLADQKVIKKLAALERAEMNLKELLTLADAAAENDLSQLTTVYENMKPKAAAALFEQMDSRFAAGFLGRMKPASAAAVMAGLSAEKAYEVSFILAGRNAQTPNE